MPLQLAILASGRGSNAKAIIDAIKAGTLDATIQCVICNVENAGVLDIAQQAGIPAHCIPHAGLKRPVHEAQVLEALSAYEVDYLVLAGYMRLMTPGFLLPFKDDGFYRVVNIHPSLLPAFPGANGYEDAFHYGVKVSGVTVHLVDEALDNGPIILQEAFPRLETDSLEAFKQRGLAIEHQLYPKALQLIADKRLCFRYDSVSERAYVEVKTHATT